MPTRKDFAAASLILGLAGLLSASACSSPEPATPPVKDPPVAAKPITAEDRVHWYEECWSYFNDKKWAEFKNCYAENARSQQVGYGHDAAGPDAIVASSMEFARSAPDVRGQSRLILVNGPHVASIFLLQGTNSGPMRGVDGKEIPATNKKFGLLFGHAIDVAPAALKVVKEIGVQDSGTFLSQLGLSKMPARPVMEKGAEAGKLVVAKDDATESANVDVAKAQVEAWNKHDAAAVDALVADDAAFRDVTGPRDTNKKESSESNKNYWKAFPDARLSTSSIWGAGHYVVMIGTFEGTNDGASPAMNLEKTGKKVSLPFLAIARLEEGKFKKSWLFSDSGAFAAQLGLMPGE